MDYESVSASHAQSYMHTASRRRSHATLEEQLLSYSENAENEGEEEAYLEEEVLQVPKYSPLIFKMYLMKKIHRCYGYHPHTTG